MNICWEEEIQTWFFLSWSSADAPCNVSSDISEPLMHSGQNNQRIYMYIYIKSTVITFEEIFSNNLIGWNSASIKKYHLNLSFFEWMKSWVRERRLSGWVEIQDQLNHHWEWPPLCPLLLCRIHKERVSSNGNGDRPVMLSPASAISYCSHFINTPYSLLLYYIWLYSYTVHL